MTPCCPPPPQPEIEARLMTLGGDRAARLARLLPQWYPGAMSVFAKWLALVFVEFAAWMKCREITCTSASASAGRPQSTGAQQPPHAPIAAVPPNLGVLVAHDLPRDGVHRSAGVSPVLDLAPVSEARPPS